VNRANSRNDSESLYQHHKYCPDIMIILVLIIIAIMCVCKERRRRALDDARKQWLTADQDGYYDRSTTTLSLRRLPQYNDNNSRSNGNCVIAESSDTAPDSPALTRGRTTPPVTPAIPEHHHLYWQATGARCHGNDSSQSPTAID